MTAVHDDTAFYTFACVLLLCYSLPSSIYICVNVCYRRRFSFWIGVQVLVLSVVIYVFLHLVQFLQDGGAYFDPHEILGLGLHASEHDIRRAYRKLSLRYHPDKIGPAESPGQFNRIAKAYEALTDPIAKRNYERYGHPDGRQSLSVAIGLPSMLLPSDEGTTILLVYALGLGFLLSSLTICLVRLESKSKSQTRMSREHSGKVTRAKPSRETLKMLQHVPVQASAMDILFLMLKTRELKAFQDLISPAEMETLLIYFQSISAIPTSVQRQVEQELERDSGQINICAILCHVYHQGASVAQGKSSKLKSKLKSKSRHTVRNHDNASSVAMPETILRPYLAELLPALEDLLDIFILFATDYGWTKSLEETCRLFPLLAQGVHERHDDQAIMYQNEHYIKRVGYHRPPRYQLKDVRMYVDDEDDIQCNDVLITEMTILRRHLQPGESASASFPSGGHYFVNQEPQVGTTNNTLSEFFWIVITDKETNELVAVKKVRRYS